jgi:hypothetical protein
VSGIENGGADFAVLKMLLHDRTHFRRDPRRACSRLPWESLPLRA